MLQSRFTNDITLQTYRNSKQEFVPLTSVLRIEHMIEVMPSEQAATLCHFTVYSLSEDTIYCIIPLKEPRGYHAVIQKVIILA